MGDPNQLRPVKTNHNVFSVSLDIPITRIDLKESKRFSPEYESIIQQLRYYVDTNDETGPRIRLWTRTKKGMSTTYVDVKVGCHVFIIQNGVSLASKGTPLLFEKYNAEQDCIECMDPVKKLLTLQPDSTDFSALLERLRKRTTLNFS
ncbi:uncharacterized protein TNCV_1584371 [Trichonephila clavipes]|nr:uncharacterized protein TNCV_1584371 [Trichonephila clavipes]